MSTKDGPLFLVGVNIDAEDAYTRSRQRRITQVAPRTYVSLDLTDEQRIALLRRNSARIASLAYPSGALAGSSAFHRGQVDGHILMAMPWARAPLLVAGAFTIHFLRTEAEGINGEIVPIEFEDDFGLGTVKRLGDDMLIIKSFQPSKGRPPQTNLSPADLVAVVERRLGQLGSAQALADRLDSLARAHGLAVYAPAIREYIGRFGHYEARAVPHRSFKIYWHDAPIASLEHDGSIWHFDYAKDAAVTLSVSERKGRRSVPSFLGSILPEVGAGVQPSMIENLDLFSKWSRFLSNITVLPTSLGSSSKVVADVLEGRLASKTDATGQFSGHIDPHLVGAAADQDLIASLQAGVDMPRISGQQVKMAVCLTRAGEVVPATGSRAFTHMLKVPPPHGPFEAMGSMEWFSLQVAKACKLKTETFALVDMGDSPPALLVERFDVRQSKDDKRHYMSEDFWSVFGMQVNEHKYRGELLEVASVIKKHSTNPAEDARHLLLQAAFSWLTINGDLHLKNLSLLKVADGPGQDFSSVELAPMYDVLCTRVFPTKHLTAAIKLAGSHVHTLDGFRTLGKRLGICQEETDTLINYLALSIQLHSARILDNIPDAIRRHKPSLERVKEACKLFEARCYHMIQELSAAHGADTGHAASNDGQFDAGQPEPAEEAPQVVEKARSEPTSAMRPR